MGTLPKAPDGTILTSDNVAKYTTYNKLSNKMIVWEGVTSISSNTFTDECAEETDITTLILPNTLTAVGEDTFNDYIIKNLTLGSGIKTIANSAFAGANTLTNLIIPDSVTNISDKAFENSPITSLKLGDGLKTIGGSAFSASDPTTLVLPPNLTSIGNDAF